MIEGDRPQDVGRSHARRGAPSPATAALLAEWQETQRRVLRYLNDRAQPKTGGLMPDAPSEWPSDAELERIVKLGIVVATSLGSAIDADPVPLATPTAGKARPRSRKRVDYGP